ncbi:MAG: hypothetical protein MnENMB40S_05560 [Rhizobiaceae bacterium MnEN-MB40S]|nr:MAG: hypothetical protein MnENMB40S_05560 [Rhizobiaceae bacterium MnEN-MB40S]
MNKLMTGEPNETGPERKWDAAGRLIVNAYLSSPEDGVPVYLRLKKCLSKLIVNSDLSVDAQLPPEQWLARALNVSLGTVQKSLNALRLDGYIERHQGHGTYVSAPRRRMTELWHYRFFDPQTGDFAPVFSKLIGRRTVMNEAAEVILGRDQLGFVEIERRIDVAGEFACFSRMYLGATHFSALMRIEPSVFDNVNLKQIFSSQFDRPTLKVTQRVSLTEPEPSVQSIIGVSPGDQCLVLTLIAQSHDGAYSFQEAFIPKSRFLLDMSLSGEGAVG